MKVKTGTWLYHFGLLRQAFGRYYPQIAILAVLGFLASIMEGIGINSVIPLFSFVSNNGNRGADAVSKMIARCFDYFHVSYTLAALLIFIALLFIGKAIVVFATGYITSRTNTGYEQAARHELFRLTLAADWPYLSGQKIGYLDQVLITDIGNCTNFLALIITSFLIAGNLAVYLLISINISLPIALFTFLLGALVIFFFKPLFYRNKALNDTLEVTQKNLAHYVNESMSGIKTIKASAVENSIMAQGDGYFEQVKNLAFRMGLTRNLTNTLLQPIGLIFIIGIFTFFYKTTAFNFASFAVIVYAINKVFSYLQLAQGQLHGVGSFLPYVANVVRYKEQLAVNAEKNGGGAPWHFSDRLEFKDVSFSYNDDRPILSGLNFSIRKGEMVGLIGPSGAGKTTIVDLALRLLEPKSGGISLDGRPIAAIALGDWRKHIGYVSQDIFLMNDTIENNIRFYNERLSPAELASAAKLANIYDFIERLPEKFATIIGERGILLSGGERQRIVLARILARRPEVLILDEATSALDNVSERLIKRAIDGLKGEVTVLAIAHRLSTVMASDRLLVLENGGITEQGQPAELLKNADSYFFKNYNIRS